MWILIALLIIQAAISTALSVLNLAHLKKHAASPPQEWAERLDTSKFPKMVAYIRAKSKLGHIARAADLALVLVILLSGLLPALASWAASWPVAPVWQGLAILAVLGAISYVSAVPWDLLSSFGVEKKFGFSTITLKTWLTDQAKSVLISLVLGVLLGGGLLLLIGSLGRLWWLPAWALFSCFQLLMLYIAPVILLPLFNKFEPLQDQELGKEIAALACRAHYPLSGVFQIDASLRSTHANAYFTGIGKTRRIALFDTLIDQHSQEEILAIVAHEIGHWKLQHTLKTFLVSLLASAAGLGLLAIVLDLPWLYSTIGLAGPHAQLGTTGLVAAVGLYLASILVSPLGLLLAPIANRFSRKHEYAADAYSLGLYDHPRALEEGLIKLSEKNLSNLFPHPLVVAFRYSHPPLVDRVEAIRSQASSPS